MSEIVKRNAPLMGKVAGVLTERELAINIGENSGVKLGMKFKVLADKPNEVKDPETNEVLGTVDREKVRIEVSEVHEKFSVCRTYRKYVVGGGALTDLTGWGTLFAPRREITETLKAEDSAVLPELSEVESYVKRGDRVVQVIGDNE